MATLLYRLGKTAYRRWPFFLAAWLIAIVGLGGLATAISQPKSDAMTIPGIPSEKAADLQAELFPGSTDAFDQAGVSVVVQAPEGHTLNEPEYMAAIDGLVVDLLAAPQMHAEGDTLEDGSPAPVPANPVTAAQEQVQAMLDAKLEAGLTQAEAEAEIAEEAAEMAPMAPLTADGRTGVLSFEFDVDTVMDVEVDTQDAVVDAMETARDSGLTVEANGSGMTSMEAPGMSSELIGVGLALLVLVLTFGSLVAAGLPIVSAIIGVGIGMIGIEMMTAFTDIGTSTPMLATMLGLAVGIDYALFILARYRNELDHTDDREEAVGVAVGTAGSAVVFAGLTVLIALCALAVVQIPFLTTMGLAAAGTVFVAVLVALTLLPAILGMLKTKAFGGRVRKYNPSREANGKIVNNGVRWARLVGKKPIAVVLLVIVGLGALAIPMKNMHLAFPSDATSSPDKTMRKASDILAESFSPGREGPMILVADGTEVPADERMAKYDEIVDWVKGHDDVEMAMIGGVNEAETGAQIIIVPASGPNDGATEDLLADLRDGQSDIEAATGTDTGITGMTAITVDVSEQLADALPIYLAVVIGLAFILLMIVFRSILVPLTATLGFLLSVLATLGATVAIFQEEAFGLFDGQPIVSFMPLFLIGVVFGLAMDYQVFLVTRIREAHVHGADYREAVIDGFRGSARVVAAAAVIMTAVFAAFMFQEEPIIKMMGFALAAAIVFDAFIVRMTLIPALMYLMKEKAWYLPKWLDRILPNVDIEGENLHRPHMETLHRDDKDDEDLAPAGV
ncbi:MMPL family transporter [Nocardioides alcanivorans]|uniref:MMPL family transporter n=1 Tax=Nocardioides alcanivorans TaxID=2897352 RepID=UPI001F3D7631|nr:MMPL family transporter [Nocardioides alcanivorans]